MIINTINTRQQGYNIKDVHIVSDSEGIEAVFIGDNENSCGVIRASYPPNFHPSDEFKDKICRDLRNKYLRYWKSDNIYSLSSDLNDFSERETETVEL